MRLFGGPARRREKVFGEGRAIPLDRNAKARLWAYARSYTARLRQHGQHRGPLTRAYLDVLRALLWGFHNQHTGRCFPSYERIAEAASVSRATVARAIAALEAAGLLTWQNRLVRQRVALDGLLGPTWTLIPRRTSNAYCFRDPQPLFGCPEPKSQNSTGTRNQVSINLSVQTETDLDPDSPLSRALNRLKNAIDRHPLPTKEDA